MIDAHGAQVGNGGYLTMRDVMRNASRAMLVSLLRGCSQHKRPDDWCVTVDSVAVDVGRRMIAELFSDADFGIEEGIAGGHMRPVQREDDARHTGR